MVTAIFYLTSAAITKLAIREDFISAVSAIHTRFSGVNYCVTISDSTLPRADFISNPNSRPTVGAMSINLVYSILWFALIPFPAKISVARISALDGRYPCAASSSVLAVAEPLARDDILYLGAASI